MVGRTVTHTDLIESIALILSDEKAYDLPAYGLEFGEESEAFNSKRIYITKRLKGKDQLFLIDVAKRIAKDYQSNELSRLLNILSPSGFFEITQITRRNIMDYLYSGSIHGEIELIDFLSRIWNVDRMPAVDTRFHNARGDIIQHMYNNDDWDFEYLFETYLDIFNLPDESFILFVEQSVHPQVRKNHQAEYVDIINKHLVNDGMKD
jgi:hypothetical protein